jgi:hypothetical protein
MRSIRVFALLMAFGLLFSTAVHARPVSEPSGSTHKFLPVPRKVFWKGVLTIKVPSFEDAHQHISAMAMEHHGNTFSQEVHSHNDGRRYGVVYVRVPEAERNNFLEEAQTLGQLYSEKISAPDVSEEYVDLGRRQRNLLAEEDQLLQILKQAHHVLEVLQVQGHLFNVRVESEQIASRINEIELKSDTALFALNFFEPSPVAQPTSPGGASLFLPRWWQYTAEPLLKKQVRDTWYVTTGKVIDYLTGVSVGIPNVGWLGVYALTLAAFLRFIWPGLRAHLSQLTSALHSSDVPWQTILAGMACIAIANLVLPSGYVVVMFSVVVLIAWRQFSTTESGVKWLSQVARRGIPQSRVHLAVALPVAFSVTQAFVPDMWTDYTSILLHSLALLSLPMILPFLWRCLTMNLPAWPGRSTSQGAVAISVDTAPAGAD